jgi:hypothetical protein
VAVDRVGHTRLELPNVFQLKEKPLTFVTRIRFLLLPLYVFRA